MLQSMGSQRVRHGLATEQWVVLLNTILDSLTEEATKRVYHDNARGRATINFRASPRLL